MEAPDVRFEDVVIIERPKYKKNWSVETCQKFRSVCEKGTLEIIGYSTDKPCAVGLSIDDNASIKVNSSLK